MSFKGNEFRIFICPQCDKSRMKRPLDHKVDRSKSPFEASDGSTVELHSDVCDFCVQKNFAKYFLVRKSEVEILKALQEGGSIDLESSL
jgi:hypothetical protein